MPLETGGSTIADLNPSNPAHSDPLSQADAHMRLIKLLILNTFPHINAALDITDEQLNELAAAAFSFADGSVGTPTLRSLTEPTLGFYRASAGHLGFSKRLVGNGANRVGSVEMFLVAPDSFGTSSTPGTTFEYLELNGAVYAVADYPDLGPKMIAAFGTTFGGNGVSTFGVPTMTDTARFPRSRSASIAVGTKRASAIKNHTHTYAGTTSNNGAHNHAAHVGDPGHAHTLHNSATSCQGGGVSVTTPAFGSGGSTSAGSTDTAFTGISVTLDGVGDHAHTYSGTTDANPSGDAGETRPEDIAFIFAVKT